MLAQPLILLAVALHLFASRLDSACHHLFFTQPCIVALQKHRILAETYRRGVARRQSTFAVTQIVNGIEQVGFAHAIIAQKAVYLIRKGKTCLCDILIVEY